eukprot:TRINITY_DN37126_c0_g1_i1.p1 TRINITY_DN37126_c0_g1~~TRINITY_DN37126_c0_g1_i1.p1  ORF type:complete len:240 (+),score=61.87 TRINITY_DN37126_c0_g1_i1:43-762(+)
MGNIFSKNDKKNDKKKKRKNGEKELPILSPRTVLRNQQSNVVMKMMFEGMFDYYSDPDGLWTYDQIRTYFKEIEDKDYEWETFVSIRKKLPQRVDQPFTGMDKLVLRNFFELSGLDISKFVLEKQPVRKLKESHRLTDKNTELEKKVSNLTAQNLALKDRCSGMNRRLKSGNDVREKVKAAANELSVTRRKLSTSFYTASQSDMSSLDGRSDLDASITTIDSGAIDGHLAAVEEVLRRI